MNPIRKQVRRNSPALFCVVLGVFLLLWGCSPRVPAPEPVAPDVLAGLPFAPPRQADLLGKMVLTLADADVVYPAFSPDGRWLAWASVVVKGSSEFTGVWVRDLKRGVNQLLLDADQSGKYATYSAFVYDLHWESDHTLVANISDGDVDTTRIRWRLPEGSKLDESAPNTEGEFLSGLRAKAREFDKKPDLPGPVLETALQNSFRISRGLFVGQIQHAGHEDHIRMFHPDGRMDLLMELPERPGYGLTGGFRLGGDIVFLLTGHSHDAAHLFVHRKGANHKLISLKAPSQNATLKVLSQENGGVWMLARLGYSHTPPDQMGLFFYQAGRNGGTLLRPRGFDERVHSAAVSVKAGMIALSLWQGKTRRLSLRRLGPEGR